MKSNLDPTFSSCVFFYAEIGSSSKRQKNQGRASVDNFSGGNYIDTHNHLVGRRKQGKYNFERQAQIALQAMNKAGIKMNFLLPMPQAVGQKLKLTFEDLLPIVEKYPDRFVIGSDEIIKPANNHPSAGSITSTGAIIQQLPEELRAQIGYENAQKIYKLK